MSTSKDINIISFVNSDCFKINDEINNFFKK